MSIPQLEAALREARECLSRAVTDPETLRIRTLNLEEIRVASDTVLQAERNLAAAKGEPYAVPIEFPVTWDTGAPLPYLLQNDYRTFLTFFVHDVDPDWDGSYVAVRHPSSDLSEKLAVVEFDRCACTKMGTPNDEVLHGHPLNGKGLRGYIAMSVENSAWVKELQKINSVHSGYRAGAWRGQKHYILPFHDCTFECVAEGFKIEVFQMPLPELLAEICKRLVQ
jgi:hypothetical protein